MSDGFVCRSRKCEKVASLISKENGRGFCTGILKTPYARTDPNDVIKFCFIERDRPSYGYVVTPAEAVTLSSLLAWAYHEYCKERGADSLVADGPEKAKL